MTDAELASAVLQLVDRWRSYVPFGNTQNGYGFTELGAAVRELVSRHPSSSAGQAEQGAGSPTLDAALNLPESGAMIGNR